MKTTNRGRKPHSQNSPVCSQVYQEMSRQSIRLARGLIRNIQNNDLRFDLGLFQAQHQR